MATKKALVVSTLSQTIDNADTLLVGAGVDASSAGALAVGAATATSVVVTPRLNANGGVDRSTAGALNIGALTATSVVITPNVGVGVTPTSTFSVGSSGTERFRVDGATGRIVEYSDGVPANGEVLIGNGTNFAKSTLTAGTGIDVANSAGAVTISAGTQALFKAADQSVTGSTLAVDNTLDFFSSSPAGTLLPNTPYCFEYYLVVSSNNNPTANLLFQLAAVAVAGSSWYDVTVLTDVTSTFLGTFSAFNTTLTANLGAYANVRDRVFIRGTYTPSASGTLRLLYASQDIDGTVTVLRGSYLRVWRAA
jgi:hypothetical protein